MSKKKTSGKFATKKKKSNKGLVTVLVLTVILLTVLVILLLRGLPEGETHVPVTEEAVSTAPSESTSNPSHETTSPEETGTSLGYGLYITDFGSYTGMYMEDGSDEILSGILMMVVKNDGEQDIQYARIDLPIGEETASFTLTTLPVGESVVLLETGRKPWNSNVDYTALLPKAENVAYFQEPRNLHADQLKIGIVDGAINVTNISGVDIPGNIAVYYKNTASDIYYGGITYRITIQGGLKADEIRQTMTNHASDTGSEIMFVTISQ